jgi:hypothetical protein
MALSPPSTSSGAFPYSVFDSLHKLLPQSLFPIINKSEKKHPGNNMAVGHRNVSTTKTHEDI